MKMLILFLIMPFASFACDRCDNARHILIDMYYDSLNDLHIQNEFEYGYKMGRIDALSDYHFALYFIDLNDYVDSL